MTAHYMIIEGAARARGERLSVGAPGEAGRRGPATLAKPAPVAERKNRVVGLTADPHHTPGRNGGRGHP